MSENTKCCSRCKVAKPVSEFNFEKGRKDGFQGHCRQCHSGPLKKASYLRCLYGVSLEWFEDKLKRQNGVCAICKERCPSGKHLGVDHDHVTGKIRELLCSNCNGGLGHFKDDPELLRQAALYLEKHRGTE